MESKKKKFTYKDILFKSKRLTAAALVVAFGAGLLLTQTGKTEIPVHDGDVLVDSLAVAEEKEKDMAAEGSFDERRAALELAAGVRNARCTHITTMITDSCGLIPAAVQ